MGGHVSDPVMGVCRAISALSGRSLPAVCVETGTYRGEGTERFAKQFSQVHTIELSERWFEYSRDKLAPLGNVTCHHGDSVSVLRDLLPSLESPTLFFLDAHYSGGTTALGEDEVPLLQELELICGRLQQDVLIIDDARLIGQAGTCGYENDTIYPTMNYDWRTVTKDKIRRLVGSRLNNTWISWWDKIIIFRNQKTVQGIVANLGSAPFNACDVPMRFGKKLMKSVGR